MKNISILSSLATLCIIFQPGIAPKSIFNTKNLTKKTTELQKFTFLLILLILPSLGFSSNTQSQRHEQNLLSDFAEAQTEPKCSIGFMSLQKLQSEQILVTDNQVEQLPYTQFAKSPEKKFWLYCKFLASRQKDSRLKPWKYSIDWQQCSKECCISSDKDQCYFMTLLSLSRSIQQKPYIRLRALQSTLESQQLSDFQNPESKPQSPTTSESQNTKETGVTNQAESGSSDTGIQVMVIILACVFGVPFLLLLFFSILSIIRMCRNSSGQQIQPFGIVQNRTPEDVLPEIINLEEYQIDEVGPFMINPKEQCPICLDENVNARTYCGHHYHPKCIKSWLSKVRNKCPVCMGHHPNPMKVYCKKCAITIKLVVLNEGSIDAQVNELNEIICPDCRSDQHSQFSRSLRREQESGAKKKSIAKRKTSNSETKASIEHKEPNEPGRERQQNSERKEQNERRQSRDDSNQIRETNQAMIEDRIIRISESSEQ